MNRGDALAAPESLETSSLCEVWTVEDDEKVDAERVIEEVPVALVYNGISHAVMLATPADLEDFALGFSLTEGVVSDVAEVYAIEVSAGADGVQVEVTIGGACMASLKARRRSMAGRTGCGLCGVENLREAIRPVPRVGPLAACLQSRPPLGTDAIDRAVRELGAAQSLHRATGAAHAAGFARASGELMLSREDVGRHNALDKLVGAMAAGRHHNGLDPEQGFIAVTSRASYEMVHKAAAARVPVLVALSAPTALAVRTAEQAGLTLVGSAGRRRRIYSHPFRLTTAAPG